MEIAQADPKGLIRESYAIEGITAGECRSIFLDWALSLGPVAEPAAAAAALLIRYGTGRGGHPMTGILQEAVRAGAAPHRRGGRAGRLGQG